MVHTAEITYRASGDLYKSFTQLKDTIHLDNKNHINTRYKDNGLVIHAEYKINNVGMRTYQFYNITIRINFKKLIEEDYNKKDLYTDRDFEKVEQKFNEMMQELNINMPPFMEWKVNRIDYCINVKTPYVKEYMNILHKSDMPNSLEVGYNESRNYSKNKGSLYLTKKKNGKKKYTPNITINFYDKQDQLENMKKKGHDITDKQIASAKDILRLEVQCHKSKTEYLKVKHSMTAKNIHYFLDPHISYDVISLGLSKIVKPATYRRKAVALKKIEDSKHTNKTKAILKQIINDIAKQHSAIHKVRESYMSQGMKKETFNNYLKYLVELDINPVTIRDRAKLQDKRLDEGLDDLFTLFVDAFEHEYYDEQIEV